MRDAIAIIGAGECGARAALTLREFGYRGDIILIGKESLLPYERPPLSKRVLTADAGTLLPTTVVSAERLVEARITCMTGATAVAINRSDKAVILAGGPPVFYSKLLLATGATAKPLAVADTSHKHCAYLRTFDDARHIRGHLQSGARVIVVGGGFIGLEVAAGAIKNGTSVTVLEALPRVLSRVVPEQIAAIVDGRHRREGVTIRCGVGLTSVEGREESIAATLSDLSRIEADLLVIGVGAVPAVELAKDAGLNVANGIAVDQYLRTNDPDVYAAGDCCSFPLDLYGGRRVRLESWRGALEQGSLVARNMLGANEAISSVPWFWSDQYDLTLQIAGLPDEGVETVRRDLGDGAFLLFHIDGCGRLVAASGIGPGNAVARDIRIAEMLIARRVKPNVRLLSTPATKLKSLLAGLGAANDVSAISAVG